MEGERLFLATNQEAEASIGKSLCSQLLIQYTGQDRVEQELAIYIEAAKNRNGVLDRTLLYGLLGLGKTTMATVVISEVDASICTTGGSTIERAGDLVVTLSELESGDVLLIDRARRLPRVVEEMLYPATEDFYTDTVVGQGTTAYPAHFPLPPFTLVGATTRVGMLSAPLRDRFGTVSHMEYYQEQDSKEIVLRSMDVSQMGVLEEGVSETTRRSRETPRVANRLLKCARGFAQVQSDDKIDRAITDKASTLLQVGHQGPDYVGQKLLKTMIDLYGGDSAGLSTLSVDIGEETKTVEDMYEPYLIQESFIKRTLRGRIATPFVYTHLGHDYLEGRKD